MIDLGSDRLVVRLLVAIVMASAIFTFWPGIDLFVSGWFFDEEHGFWLSDLWLIKIVREAIYALMAATLVGALAFAIMGLLGFRPWGVPPNLWGFIAAYFLVGPLWFANVVLKNNWGRARPANVEEFQGDKAFTPALRWANECIHNCSFISGEGSGATVLAIAMILLAPYVLKNQTKARREKMLAWALCIPAIAIVLRIVMGRHFLSDTVFAILFMLIIGTLLHRVFLGRRSQEPKTVL